MNRRVQHDKQCSSLHAEGLKNLENLKLFKKQLKSFLLQQSFYSVDEYLSYVYV